jgi:hypothetical protein
VERGENVMVADNEEITLSPGSGLILSPVMNLAVAKQRLKEFQEFVHEYLQEGEDFGTIPGTPKPTLYKPGADKLCELYGLSDSYTILSKIEDFESGLFDYTVECVLTSRAQQVVVSTGLGACSSYESKYRWRDGRRVCPKCGKDCIIKGKEEYGGGWLCFAKKGGCGAKFGDKDPSIVSQSLERVPNPDIIDMKNTILKMAKKRSKVDATLSATRSSGLFTQDMEDIKGAEPEPEHRNGSAQEWSTDAEKAEIANRKIAELKQTASQGRTAKKQASKPTTTPQGSPTPESAQMPAISSEPGSGRRAESFEVGNCILVKLVPGETEGGASFQNLVFDDGNGGEGHVKNWHKSLIPVLALALNKPDTTVWVHRLKDDSLVLDDVTFVGGDVYEKGQKVQSGAAQMGFK